MATLDSNATYVGAIQEGELDVSVVSGASVQQSVLTLYGVNSDAVHGSVTDAMLLFGRDATTTVGWNYGIAFGRSDSQWPSPAGGTIIGTYAPSEGSRTATNGVDWRNVTFSGYAYASTGFGVDGSGNVTTPSVNFGGSSLSTYVQSTWTPTVNGATTSGTGQTYTPKWAHMSRLVARSQRASRLLCQDLVQRSGNLLINGLPVAAANVSNDNGICTIGYYSLSSGYSASYPTAY